MIGHNISHGHVVSILDFVCGCHTDEIRNGEDAAETFAEAGKYLRTLDRKALHTVVFPRGMYWSSEGWHFTNIPRIRFQGESARLIAHGRRSDGKANGYLTTQNPFYRHDDIETQLHTSEQTADAGAFTSQALAGDNTITLADPADAADFSEGAVAWIGGLDIYRSDGNPPSLQFFEWVTIDSIQGGVLHLRGPLRHTYRSTWHDYGNVFTGAGEGPARVIPWEDRGCALTYEMSGFALVPRIENLSWNDDIGYVVPNAMVTYLHDLHAPDTIVYPTVAKSWTAERCVFGATELDKDIEHCNLMDCSLDRLASGTNIQNLHMDRCDVLRRDTAIRCKNATYRDSTFPPGTGLYQNIAGTTTVERCSFRDDGQGLPWDTGYLGGSSLPYQNNQLAEAQNQNGVCSVLVWPLGGNAFSTVDVGDWLIVQAQGGLGYIHCLVVGIDQDPQGRDMALVQSDGPAQELEPRHLLPNGHQGYFADQNRTLPRDGAAARLLHANGFAIPRTSGRGQLVAETNLYDHASPWGSYHFGKPVRLVSIRVDVRRPYSGPDSSARLLFDFYHGDPTSWGWDGQLLRMDIDLRVKGLREITSHSMIGDQSGGDEGGVQNLIRDGLVLHHTNGVQSSTGFLKLGGDIDNGADPSVMPVISAKMQFDVLDAQSIRSAVR